MPQQQELEEAAHVASTVQKQRETNVCGQLTFKTTGQGLSLGNDTTHSGRVFPRPLMYHGQNLVLTKLTVGINHHSRPEPYHLASPPAS